MSNKDKKKGGKRPWVSKYNWPPAIFNAKTWKGWMDSIAGKTKCETCGKKYNNYVGVIGEGGVPFAKICYTCLNKTN